MKITKYPAPPIETAASRYDRDWLNIPDLDTAGNDDDRHDRTLLQQTVERKSRRYVTDGISAVTGGSGEEPNYLWIDNFDGPELDPRWSTESPENIILSNGSLTNAGTVKLTAMNNAVMNKSIHFSLDEVPVNAWFGVFATNDDVSRTAGLSIIGAGASEFVGQLSDSSGDVLQKDINDSYDLRGDHILSFSENSLQWIHNGELLGEIPLSEVASLAHVSMMFMSEGATISQFGIIGASENGGGTPEPEEPVVPEGSYQEIFTENY